MSFLSLQRTVVKSLLSTKDSTIIIIILTYIQIRTKKGKRKAMKNRKNRFQKMKRKRKGNSFVVQMVLDVREWPNDNIALHEAANW